jgi:hypothetical protein
MPGPARDFAGKKVKTKHLQISLSDPVVDRLDGYWLENKADIDNRAHAVRTLIRMALELTQQPEAVAAVPAPVGAETFDRDIHLDVDIELYAAVRTYYEQRNELTSMSAAFRELIHSGLVSRKLV